MYTNYTYFCVVFVDTFSLVLNNKYSVPVYVSIRSNMKTNSLSNSPCAAYAQHLKLDLLTKVPYEGTCSISSIKNSKDFYIRQHKCIMSKKIVYRHALYHFLKLLFVYRGLNSLGKQGKFMVLDT